MIPPLLKIDVATVITGQSINVLYERAEGTGDLESALVWVFDFSRGASRRDVIRAHRRDLRFWHSELTGADVKKLTLEQVLETILPSSKKTFQAGEVDHLFQLRPRTRLDLCGLEGELKGGRNSYTREKLAGFLQDRWIGFAKNRSRRQPPEGTGPGIPQS